MIEKITDQNLERYDSRLKEWCDRKFFEKGNYGKYQTTEEAGAVAFYPAPNTLLEGKIKFSFKETMPANGDKGPDNPSTIIGVSSVGVADRSKNIYDFPNLSIEPYNGVTITCDADGTITLNGTCNLSSSQSKELYYIYPVAIKIISQVKVIGSIHHIGGTYDISGSNSNIPILVQVIRQSQTTGSFGYIWLEDTGIDQTSVQSWNASNVALIFCSLRFFGGAVYNNYKIKVQYEISSNSTIPSSYEPPARDAFVVTPLDNTYYGGEIDLATGVMTVTWINKILDRESLTLARAGYTYNVTNQRSKRFSMKLDGTAPGLPEIKNISNITSNYFNLLSQPMTYDDQVFGTMYVQPGANTWFMIYDDNEVITSINNTVYKNEALFKDWFEARKTEGNPVTITYELATPYTVQLTPTQILSLTQFDKYTPRLNTVYTDADSVQISYLKSPIRDEYEKTQAILSLGGNS